MSNQGLHFTLEGLILKLEHYTTAIEQPQIFFLESFGLSIDHINAVRKPHAQHPSAKLLRCIEISSEAFTRHMYYSRLDTHSTRVFDTRAQF